MTNKQQFTLFGIVSFITASLFLCYEMGLQVALAVVTTPLMRDLNFDAANLGWLTACYFIAYTLMQIPGGLLYDRFSCRNVMTLSALCCALGALLFIKTSNIPLLFLARFLIGAGSAFPFVGVLVVASKCFPRDTFAIFVGITQLLAAMGAFLGSAPLSYLVDRVGWQHAMYDAAIAGFAIVALSWFGIAKLAPDGNVKPTHISKTLAQIVKNKQTWIIAAYAFFNWGPVIILSSLWGEPFLVEKMAISTTKAAVIVQNIWLGISLGSVTVGYLSEKFNRRVIFMTLCGLLGTGCSILILFAPIQSIGLQSFMFFLCGIAASGQILSFAMVRELQPENIVGTAIGFNNMAVVAGGFILQPLIGELMKFFWHGKTINSIPHYSILTYQKSLMIMPCCFAICLAVTYFLREKNTDNSKA